MKIQDVWPLFFPPLSEISVSSVPTRLCAIIPRVARVYLETSFFIACVSLRQDLGSAFRRDVGRRWWIQERLRHELFVSAEVVRELSSPNHIGRNEALSMAADASMLTASENALRIAETLVREKAMPGPADAGDATHVAIAATHQIQVMLSWNVKHLANPNKVIHLREVCRKLGITPPEIVTPEAFWSI